MVVTKVLCYSCWCVQLVATHAAREASDDVEMGSSHIYMNRIQHEYYPYLILTITL